MFSSRNKRGQHRGDLLCLGRRLALVGEGKGDGGLGGPAGASVHGFGADGDQFYVFTQLYDDFIIGEPVFQFRVGVELVEDLLKPTVAHNALVDGLQPLFHIGGHRRHDKIIGYLLLLDQNGGAGYVDGGQ